MMPRESSQANAAETKQGIDLQRTGAATKLAPLNREIAPIDRCALCVRLQALKPDRRAVTVLAPIKL
jgi:hypothetical protein